MAKKPEKPKDKLAKDKPAAAERNKHKAALTAIGLEPNVVDEIITAEASREEIIAALIQKCKNLPKAQPSKGDLDE